MKLTITGLSNSGKTTVFNALTGLDQPVTSYPSPITAETEPHFGVVKIPDPRLERLASIYKPRKNTYATVEYVDYPGIAAGGDTSQNIKVFNTIKDTDAIVHVVRAFEDDSVIHPSGSIDPVRDVKILETELVFGDLEFVEKRLERMEEAAKKGRKQADEAEKNFLLACRKALEEERTLRDVAFNEEEKKRMLPYQFLTVMPEIILLNIDEKTIRSDKINRVQREIEDYFSGKGQRAVPPVLALPGKLEMEIAQIPRDEAKAFLDDLGIDEPAMNRLCRVSYEALGLISFFTIGQDETKAWTIKKGTTAQTAAGKIHSDMEKGFIRAEVIGYDDFVLSDGNMVRAKEKGLVRLEGKPYPVKDGDIIHFKFNV